MNTLLKNLLILTFGVLTVNAGSIATVDEQKVLSEYVAFNQAREKVLASVAPIQEEIQKMQEEITNIIAEAREADATSNNPALDDDARDEARSKLIGYQTELQNKASSVTAIFPASTRAWTKWSAARINSSSTKSARCS